MSSPGVGRDRANSERGVDNAQLFRRSLSRIYSALDDSRTLKGTIRDDIKKNLATMSTVFEGLLNEFIKTEERVDELHQELEHRHTEERPSKPLYSEIIQRPIPRHDDAAVLVYPSKGMEAIEPRKLLEKVKQEVNLKDLKVGVKNTRTVRSGVVITCCTSGGASRLKEKLQENFEVKETTKRKPRIMITRAPLDITAEALRSNIRIFNDHMEEELFSANNFKPAFQVGKRADRNLCSWVVEVDPRTRKAIAENGDFLSIGWSSHKVRDFYSFRRCYKCWAYGHLAKQCKAEVVCPNCAATGHDSSQCTVRREEFQCINCLKYNRGCHTQESRVDPYHGARDRHCPFFRYQCQLADAHTQY